MLDPSGMGWEYHLDWGEKHRDVLDRVLDHIRRHGPVRSADFDRADGRAGGWWEWKAEKRALEALDVAPARWVADYYRTARSETARTVRELGDEGALVRVHVEGWKEPGYVHPDNLDLARRAADHAIRPTLTTLLSPFDPLVWDRARAREMFGFDYELECYTPAHRRRWGYFALPILRRGALVGRPDAKAHRKEGRFEVKAIYLEQGVRVSDALVEDIAGALRDVAAWHGTPEVTIGRAEPAALADALEAVLADALEAALTGRLSTLVV